MGVRFLDRRRGEGGIASIAPEASPPRIARRSLDSRVLHRFGEKLLTSTKYSMYLSSRRRSQTDKLILHQRGVRPPEFPHVHEVDQPSRGTTDAPSLEQQDQVERDWRRPAMSRS